MTRTRDKQAIVGITVNQELSQQRQDTISYGHPARAARLGNLHLHALGFGTLHDENRHR